MEADPEEDHASAGEETLPLLDDDDDDDDDDDAFAMPNQHIFVCTRLCMCVHMYMSMQFVSECR